PLWMSVQATGEIRNYQLIVSFLILINLPLAYAVLKLGLPPTWALGVRVVMNFFTTLWRVFYLRGKIGLPTGKFLRGVIFKSFFVGGLATTIPVFVFQNIHDGWIQLVASGTCACLSTAVFVWFLGFEKNERDFFSAFLVGRLPFLRNLKKR
ncbi:MAG: hypothetical protein IJW39_03075, partial [Opitutales bacterium]|nr:hypothetical protein [Opitutales bacterium]